MSWDMQPTIKELLFSLEMMLWHCSSFHWRSGQWQHRSCQGKVDVSVMFHLTQQAGQDTGPHSPLHHPHLLACVSWSLGRLGARTNFEYRSVVTEYLICQPIYGNIELCQKWQGKHLLWFRMPAFYLGHARDSKSVNKQLSEEGI